MSCLINKHIVVGVSGGIAAYKTVDLVRRLREEGAMVRVVMTEHAMRFVTPLTFQAVSGQLTHTDLFDLNAEAAMGHIELARWADMLVIAPASADFLARLAYGHANDLLTTLCLATTAPIMVAPAMNQMMWHANATQNNLQRIKEQKIQIIGPASGIQACGEVGLGRMVEPLEILENISAVFQPNLLTGTNVLVTAGPTHEPIDPVRYITNISSGKMGYALAQAAQEVGAKVTLVSGPVQLQQPANIELIKVQTAREMHDTVMKMVSSHDIFISVAAVADYHCPTIAEQKIHKTLSTFNLTLTPNPDIVRSVTALSNKPFVVGFAAETENLKCQAQKKLLEKKMDMIIANKVAQGLGMGTDDNAVMILGESLELTLPLMHKTNLARKLIPIIVEQFRRKP